MAFLNARAVISWAAGALLIAAATGAVAGGVNADEDEGNNLRYFGFVKDTNSRGIAAAQVSVSIKGSVTLTAATDATGAYSVPVPRLLPGVTPENITVSCSKAGYKQLRTLVRSNLNQKPLGAVEVECTLQGTPQK